MHKIFELREMDVEQLHALASELNIKGFKKMDKDTLVYAILDEEASALEMVTIRLASFTSSTRI